MEGLVLEGGTVLTARGPAATDLLIRDGTVAEMGTGLPGGEVVDCSGCLVGPGFVDLHVHFREPGQEWKEDIDTGSEAAAAGGFTAVVVMPNTQPAIDRGQVARHVRDRGQQAGLVCVEAAGALTVARAGEELAPLEELWEAGVRIFSDDGDSLLDQTLLRRAMEYVASVDGLIAQHAEDRRHTGSGHMHQGEVSRRLGVAGLPAEAEEMVIARDLELVDRTRCRYHVQHVSTAGSVELVRSAKDRGLPVTAEVTPHHLMLDHTEVERIGQDAKMYPPLREPADVEAVREALVDGTIDAVATDHAPHTPAEKQVSFEDAPRGVIGLETAAAVVHTAVSLPPARFFERMSVTPARIGGFARHGRWIEVGIPANLVVFDPAARWVPETFWSKSRNSPFVGRELTGRVVATVREGHPTYRHGKVER